MSHDCPGPDCTAAVPPGMLMCARHWYQVPPPIRRAVWRAWADGAGAGTAEHTEAMLLAIRSVNP